MHKTDFLDSVREVLNTNLFSLGKQVVTPSSVLSFLLILLAAWIISRALQRMLSMTFRKRDLQDEGNLAAVQRLMHYVILLVGVGVGLETVGVQLTVLFTAGAVFAVAVGFAMQTILQNFVAGVILLAERAIKPGDVLEVEGMRVKVVSLGIRTTVVRTLDEEDLILPNSMLAQSMVKNFTLRDPLYRVRIPVGVVYESDMKVVMDTLRK